MARLEPLPITHGRGGARGHQRAHRHGRGRQPVRLGRAAVAHGNLSVRIATKYDGVAAVAASRARARRWSCPTRRSTSTEGDARLVTLDEGTTLDAVVRALNALGATPRDIIAIVQALKAAGALNAELVII